MNKKILVMAMLTALGTTTASAAKLNKNVEAGVYGQAVGTYLDQEDDFIYEDSHLNAYMGYHFNKKSSIKIDLGTRAFNENGEYKYDFFADEAYYIFQENETSSLKFGRFFNPVGLHGESTYNYKDHPFKVRENAVTSIDGLGLNYLGRLQKNVYFDLNVFVGTTLSDAKINGYDVDLDTGLNYGANVEIAGPAGSFNFGLYASNNGDNVQFNGVSIADDSSLFYQSNIGYEFSRNNVYFLAEYNRYEINYDDEEDSVRDTVDLQLAYKMGNLMPMIGYSYETNENYFKNDEDLNTVKAGLRYTFNENLSLLTEYNYVMYDEKTNAYDDNQVITLGLTFNY